MAKKYRTIAPKPTNYHHSHQQIQTAQLINNVPEYSQAFPNSVVPLPQSQTIPDKPNCNDRFKPDQKSVTSTAKPLFKDMSHLPELNFGSGPGYDGQLTKDSPGHQAVIRAMALASQGSVTLRSVVEIILRSSLKRDLSEYSLTGRSLAEKLEIR